MDDDISTGPRANAPVQRSWLERLGLALLGGEARSHEDLIEELHTARQNGVLDADTFRMLEGALGVSELAVADVMVPRGRMVSVNLDMGFHAILKTACESGHSRFPVFGDDEEKVLGVLLAKDLLRCFANDPSTCDIRKLLRPVRLVPESKRLNELLKEFKQQRAHMAVVVNEYGGIAGLVTIEDVLEEIVGPIDDEHDAEDKVESLIDTYADGSVVVRAWMPIEEFNAQFQTAFSDEESDTIGGLMVRHFGHLPEIGETLELEGVRFEVREADDRRVLGLLVQKLDS